MPDGLSPEEKLAFERLTFVYSKGIAYGYQMGLRPQTLFSVCRPKHRIHQIELMV